MTKYKTNSHVSVGEVRDMVPEEIEAQRQEMVERRLEREAWQRERDEIKREIEREREQVREERKREEKERKGKQNPFAGCSISAFSINGVSYDPPGTVYEMLNLSTGQQRTTMDKNDVRPGEFLNGVRCN